MNNYTLYNRRINPSTHFIDKNHYLLCHYIISTLSIGLTKDQIKDSPPLDSDAPVSRQYELIFNKYHDWGNYWEGPLTWGHQCYPSAWGMADNHQSTNSPVRILASFYSWWVGTSRYHFLVYPTISAVIWRYNDKLFHRNFRARHSWGNEDKYLPNYSGGII